MAILERYTASLREDWDAFVARNCAASYGHLSANSLLAEPGTEHSVMAYQDGALVAILPLFDVSYRRLRAIRSRALVSGLHFPAGPLFAAECAKNTRRRLTRELLDHVGRLAADLDVDRVRIAYPNVIGGEPGIAALGCLPLRDYGYREANLVSRLLPLQTDLAGLRGQMAERGRRWLRKADAAGVETSIVDSVSTWKACYPLHDRTMAGLVWPRRVLDAIWNEFVEAGFATAIAATLEGEVVTAMLTVHMNRSAYYWLGWNGPAAARSGANYAAVWRAILHARAGGAEWFELGSDDDMTSKARNISYFKASFGGRRYYSLAGLIERRPVKTSVVNALEAGVSGLRRWRTARAGGNSNDC